MVKLFHIEMQNKGMKDMLELLVYTLFDVGGDNDQGVSKVMKAILQRVSGNTMGCE